MAVFIQAGFLRRFARASYAFAVLAVVIAVGLRLAFDPILGAYAPYLPFVAAVLSVWQLGGRGPALAATALSSLSIWYFFLEPRYSFAIAQPAEAVGLGLFALIGVAISLLDSQGGLLSLRRAAHLLEPKYADLAGAPLLRRIGMLAAAALALGVLASSLWSGLQRSMDAEDLVAHTYQVLNAAANVRSSVEAAEISQREYLFTRSGHYLDAYQSAIASEQQATAALRRLTLDNRAQQARLDELDRMVRARMDLLTATIKVRNRQGMEAAAAVVRSSGGAELMDRVRGTLSGVEEEEHRLLHQRTMAASAADSQTRWILGLGSGSLVLLLILAAAIIERQMRERTLAEKTLTRQSRLIDLSHDAIIAADGNRVITGWNCGAEEMYGWTEAEALGKILPDLLKTSNHIPLPEIDAILAREGRWEGELNHTGRDGRQIVTECRQVAMRNDAGGLTGYLEINRDITERKQAEEALRESEQRVRRKLESVLSPAEDIGDLELHDIIDTEAIQSLMSDFMELTHVPVAILDTKGSVLVGEYKLYTCKNSLGDVATPFVVGGQHLGNIFTGQFPHMDRTTIGTAIEFLRKFGEIVGKLSFANIKLAKSLNQLQRAQEALVEESEQRRLALEAADLGAWDYRFETGEVFWDERCRNLFGIASGNEIDYREAIARIHPEDRASTDAAVARTLAGAGHGAYHREFRVVWPDSSIHWVASHGRAYFEDDGGAPRARRFVGVNMDITARKRAEEVLLESEERLRRLNIELEQRVLERTAQLEASNKELEAFAYSVSHDLRAPLRGIDGWSLALVEDYGQHLEQRALQYLDRVRSETQRMGRLIDDLLQLSRITRSAMHREAVDLSRLVESIAARLRESHPDRRLEFVIEPGLTAFGDARLLEIALTNLLENAVKFTRTRAAACIEFRAVECGGKSALVVRDNGVGFDMAYSSTLFGAFQRLHSESEFPGTGIGLATVQRVIHRHGGSVWAEAAPDRGASFYFTLGGEK